MFTLYLTVAVCLLSLAAASFRSSVVRAHPQPCCISSSTFEGRVTSDVEHLSNGEFRHLTEHIEFHIDASTGRFALLEDVHVNGTWIKINMIISRSSMYLILPETRTCARLPTARRLNKFCIPETAKYLGSEVVGWLGGPDLELDLWGYPLPMNSGVYIKQHVTKKACSPVLITATGELPRAVKGMTLFTVSGLKEGIADDDVFKVPDYCHKKRDFFAEWRARQLHKQRGHRSARALFV